MKKLTVLLFTVILALTAVLSGCTEGESVTKTRTQSEKYAARALEMFETAYRDFYSEEGDFVHVHFPYTDESDKIAGDWHVVALLQAGLQLRKHYPDNSFLIRATENLYGSMDYFVQARADEYLVYGVERGMFPGTAPIRTAFDDNIHIARVYMEGYQITGDQTYLDKAKELIKFVLEMAWHTQINSSTGQEIGGLGWGEGNVIDALFTCTNAPGAVMCAEMYNLTKDQYYLDWAIKIYDWTVEYLRFNNGVYTDGRSCMMIDDGTYVITDIAGTAHTYNSGFPISGGAELYQITGDEKYLQDARFTAAAAFDEFADGSYLEGLYQYPQKYYEAGNWFHQMLLEGYLALDRVAGDEDSRRYVESFQTAIDYAYDNYYRDGYLPTNYVPGGIPDSFEDERMAVLSVAANIVIYAKLAEYVA